MEIAKSEPQKGRERHTDVLIVGAGLSGITAAYYLARAGISVTLLEARSRIGGRIHTVTTDDGRGAYDLGPTWYWSHQTTMIAMLLELGLENFEQFERGHGVFEQQSGLPPQRFAAGQQPLSLRIAGGTIALVNALAAQVGHDAVHLNHVVQAISGESGGLVVQVANGRMLEGDALKSDAEITWHANQVIVTLPPHLAATTIDYLPNLPADVQQAMVDTPTWMGEAMKVSLVYDEPFWRDYGLSGMGVSYIGPVQQFHDATPADEGSAALFGWIPNHDPSRELTHSARKDAVVAQAVRLFGPQAAAPIYYDETNWEREPFTTNLSDSRRVVATMHPRYGHPLLQAPLMDGRLWWATTEAAREQGGYLDGAIYIGRQVAARIIEQKAN